jgi:hypothetical protein
MICPNCIPEHPLSPTSVGPEYLVCKVTGKMFHQLALGRRFPAWSEMKKKPVAIPCSDLAE